MKNRGFWYWLVILMFLVWSLVCWYWYTCFIKGYCRDMHLPLMPPPKSPPLTISAPAFVAPAPVEVFEEISVEASGLTEITADDTNINTQEVEIDVADENESTEPKTCDNLIDSYVRYNFDNQTQDTKDVEQFLNDFEQEKLAIDGVYSLADEAAVKRFQLKYKSEILDPWELTEPTGNVMGTTTKKINELYCQKNLSN